MSRLSKTFWNSKLYIVFILLLCFAIGYFYSYYYVTPMYQSSATVVLVQNENLEQEVAQDSSITQTDITLNKDLLSTYTKIAKSATVLEQVIQDLNLDMSINDLSRLVTVQAVNNTQVFKISVSHQDKELAPQITNHLLEVFSKEVHSLYHMNNIYTLDQAEVSNTPYNIHHTKDLAIFIMLGLVLSFGLVFVIYLLDNTIKSEKDIEDYANLSVLSTIPVYTAKSGKHGNELIVNEEPKSPISECFKAFRTNVMFSIQNKKLNTILVTSGFMGEGKSFVSSNLAVAFASSGKKVILVDTDMRKGRVHKIFNVSNEQGLSTCLAKIAADGNLVNINEFIKESHIANLHIMTSGIVPPNPSELLSSTNMTRLLEALNRQYDVVICDGTPCMLVSDSIILSKMVDTTVIVTANKATKLDTLLKMKKSIEMVGGNISGAVINKMDISQKSYKNHYYYGEHGAHKTTSFAPSVVHDTTLDSPLFIREVAEIAQTKQPSPAISSHEESVPSHSNDELMALSDTIHENTKQISELKGLYKDVMESTLNLIAKPDSSHAILDELQYLKDSYQDMSMKYEEHVTNMNDKIDNLENTHSDSNSDKILSKIEMMEKNYQGLLQVQKDMMNKLTQTASFVKVNGQPDKVLNEMARIYHHLEFINAKFESLERRASLNETLIKNLSMEVKNSLYQPTRGINIDKLNHKVIQIRDYLEKSTSPDDEIAALKIGTKHKGVLDGQMNIIDDLLKASESEMKTNSEVEIEAKPEVTFETELEAEAQMEPEIAFEENFVTDPEVEFKEEIETETETEPEVAFEEEFDTELEAETQMEPEVAFEEELETEPKMQPVTEAEIEPTQEQNTIVDYETEKRKQERKGFSFFRGKKKNTPEEEEPIVIVSQILSNFNESVG